MPWRKAYQIKRWLGHEKMERWKIRIILSFHHIICKRDFQTIGPARCSCLDNSVLTFSTINFLGCCKSQVVWYWFFVISYASTPLKYRSWLCLETVAKKSTVILFYCKIFKKNPVTVNSELWWTKHNGFLWIAKSAGTVRWMVPQYHRATNLREGHIWRVHTTAMASFRVSWRAME